MKKQKHGPDISKIYVVCIDNEEISGTSSFPMAIAIKEKFIFKGWGTEENITIKTK